MIDPQLAGKVAIVTGANNPEGMGAAIATALAAQGADVFLHYFRPDVPAELTAGDPGTPGLARFHELRSRSITEVAGRVTAAGARVATWEADLSDPRAPAELVDRAERALGPVGILVNNASHWAPGSLLGDARYHGGASPPVDAATFDRSFAVNVRAAGLLIASAAQRIRDRGGDWGRMVNISTDASASFPGELAYGASKYALESLTRSAAHELGGLGITVNVVAPGPIQTGYIRPALEERLAAETPLGRVGEPGDVADVVVFLCSEQARWVTGQLLYVGGGHRM